MKDKINNIPQHPGVHILNSFFKSQDLEEWEIEIMEKLNVDGIDIDELRMEFNEIQ